MKLNKLSWRDVVASALAILGGLVVFAKLQSYSWWMLDSWSSALVTVGIIGLAIVALYCVDWIHNDSFGAMGEMMLWSVAAAATVLSLTVETTQAEFVLSATLIGLAWLTQFGAHIWDSTHHHTARYFHAH